MKTWLFIALIGFTFCAQGADMYRWIDEKGVVNYTSFPPPPNISKMEQRKLNDNSIQTSDAPYSLQQAVKNFPVTLYVTDCGESCTSARAHLNKRGIPYTEKNPQKPEEAENFKKLTAGGMQVPLLVVGRLSTLKGYLASEWDATLDQAGYPSSPIPGVKPAVTRPAPAPAPKPAADAAAK
jgi:glutaredoxin